ncbi:MAG TPA: type II toxin-antitoxin system VapC family toxin [Kutzneria sp.]|jgi:predicted nucleic acid-binding protein
MPQAVIDTSALIEVLTGKDPDIKLRKRVLLGDLAAPELLDPESAHVLRKLAHQGEIIDSEAGEVLKDITDMAIARAPHRPLVDRVWELKDAITAYDAFFVALAEQLDVPLITCDAKLAGSNGHTAKIELYPLS